MKRIYLLLACLPLIACEGPSEYLVVSANGNMLRERRTGQIGGTRSASRSDGSSEVNSYENSLRDAANALVTYGLAGLAAPANLKGTTDPQAVPGAVKGQALLKGTKDPNVIPVDPNAVIK